MEDVEAREGTGVQVPWGQSSETRVVTRECTEDTERGDLNCVYFSMIF